MRFFHAARIRRMTIIITSLFINNIVIAKLVEVHITIIMVKTTITTLIMQDRARIVGTLLSELILSASRFPSSPLIIRVPFFLLSVLIREPKKKKGKRVLLGHLGICPTV